MPKSAARWLLGCLGMPLLLALGLALWLGLAGAPKTEPQQQPASLAEALRVAREHYGLPGIAAAYIDSGRIATAAAGVTKAGSQTPARAEHYWHLGSNSKAITATIAGRLVAEGKLDWTTTLEQLWPAEAARIHPDYRGITLRELLTHRAGVPPLTTDAEGDLVPDFSGDAPARARAFVEFVLSQPAEGERGEFLYSNAGYAIAAQMLAEASGLTYPELLDRYVTGPLQLDCVLCWPAMADPAQPWGHYAAFGMYVPHDPADGYRLDDYMAPAGDIAMPLDDYARFVQLHLRGLRGLTAELVRDLHVPVGDYSCGWGETGTGAGARSAHDGSVGTFYCTTVIEPASDLAVVVVTNAGGESAEAAVHWVAEKLLE